MRGPGLTAAYVVGVVGLIAARDRGKPSSPFCVGIAFYVIAGSGRRTDRAFRLPASLRHRDAPRRGLPRSAWGTMFAHLLVSA